MTEPRPEDTFDDTFDEESFADEADIEAPEADVLEQHTATREESGRAARRETPFEANDADAAEQDRAADTDDDDDYR
ncbi:MAG TPA: hypothetical protein VHG70_17495 [Nocardioidaceae bacterium]|jgi:hypothetical protein|nr:hypothetical protein [Nocardioidaceae bacterium]